jgi:hypothetical protein
MGTDIRPECSKKNKYWISKHRYYELKHYCLQYNEWREEYAKLSSELGCFGGNGVIFAGAKAAGEYSDRTGEMAVRLAELKRNIDLIEKTCGDADGALWSYILKGVTEGIGYPALTVLYDIPCSVDTYYDRYRRFFWLLDKAR